MADQRFPSLLQRVPRGLLSFLDIKAGGEYPTRFITELQPTIDLTSWYGSEGQHYTAVGAAVGTTGQGTKLPFTSSTVDNLSDGSNIAVPNTEIWYLQQATVEMGQGLGAADIFDAVLSIQFNTVNNRFFIPAQTLSGNPYAGVAANISYRSLDQPVLLGPGNEIALKVIRATAAAGTPFVPTARLVLLRFKA